MSDLDMIEQNKSDKQLYEIRKILLDTSSRFTECPDCDSKYIPMRLFKHSSGELYSKCDCGCKVLI